MPEEKELIARTDFYGFSEIEGERKAPAAKVRSEREVFTILAGVMQKVSELEAPAERLERAVPVNIDAEERYGGRNSYSEAFTPERLKELAGRVRVDESADFESQVREAHEIFKRNREVRELLYRAGNFDEAEMILAANGAGKGAKAFMELGRRNLEQIPSPHQLAAIENLEKGETRAVIAVPGSGKTSSLVFIMENAVAEGVVKPNEITALSYSTSAAGELRDRMTGRNPDLAGAGIKISTAHALARSIIRTYSPGTSLRVLSGRREIDAYYKGVIEKTVETLEGEEKNRTGKADAEKYALMRQKLENGQLERAMDVIRQAPWSAVQFEKSAAEYGIPADVLKTAYRISAVEKRRLGVIDFTDMLMKAVSILASNSRARAEVQSRAKLLIVDEYQDTSSMQYLFESFLRPSDGIKVIVGDDDQAIFTSLGADRNLLKNYAVSGLAGRMRCTLEKYGFLEKNDSVRHKSGYYIIPKNYRSDRAITKIGNEQGRYIPGRIPKTIIPSERAEEGALPQWHAFSQNETGDRSEFRFICETMEKGIKDGRKPEEFAVLLRWGSEVKAFTAFVEQFYPELKKSMSVTGTNANVEDFTDNKKAEAEFRPVIESLSRPESGRLFNVLLQAYGVYNICHVDDEAVSPLKEFKENAEKAGVWNREVSAFIAAYEAALEEKSADTAVRTFENIRAGELYGRPFEYETHHEDYLGVLMRKNVSREGGLDFCTLMDEEAGKGRYAVVKSGWEAMTYHKSKGREFKTVFMAGMEDAVMDKQAKKIENETVRAEHNAETERLLYVGCTRAEHECYMLSVGHSSRLSHLPKDSIRYFINGCELEKDGSRMKAVNPARVKPAKKGPERSPLSDGKKISSVKQAEDAVSLSYNLFGKSRSE